MLEKKYKMLDLNIPQLRHETGFRLAERVFDPAMAPDGGPSKWWTCWAKKKFLNDSLSMGRL